VLAALALLHRQLLVVGFDRLSARAFGARPLAADLALLALVAAGVLIGVQALGNLLVVAVIVGPAATARLLSRRIAPMMALAAGLAVAAAVAGLYVSYCRPRPASVALAVVGLPRRAAWKAALSASGPVGDVRVVGPWPPRRSAALESRPRCRSSAVAGDRGHPAAAAEGSMSRARAATARPWCARRGSAAAGSASALGARGARRPGVLVVARQ
jgi:hypothetical protein